MDTRPPSRPPTANRNPPRTPRQNQQFVDAVYFLKNNEPGYYEDDVVVFRDVGRNSRNQYPTQVSNPKISPRFTQQPQQGPRGKMMQGGAPAPTDKKLSAISVIPPATATLTLNIPEEVEATKVKINPFNPNQSNHGRGLRGQGEGGKGSTTVINLNPPTSPKSLSRTVTIPASAVSQRILDAAQPTRTPSVTSTHSSNGGGGGQSAYYNSLNNRNKYKSRTNSNYRNAISGGDKSGNELESTGTNADNENPIVGAFSRFLTLFGYGDRDYAFGPIPRGYGVTLLALGSCYSLLRYERNKIEKCKKKPAMTCTHAWYTKLKSIEKVYLLARNDLPKTTFLILVGGMGMPYTSAAGALLWCVGRLAEFHQAGDVSCLIKNKNREFRTVHPRTPTGKESDSQGEFLSDSNGNFEDLESASGHSSRIGSASEHSHGSASRSSAIDPLFCRCGKLLMICGICKLGFDCSRGGLSSFMSFN